MHRTAFTPITARERAGRRRPDAGFSLVELIVASSLSTIIMAAVLSSFLMMGRSGANAANYVVMEQQARGTLERFGQDVRMAQYFTTVSTSRVRLTIPHAADNGSNTVDYVYDATAQTFSRVGNDPVTGTPNTTLILVKNVRNCEFKRWMLGSVGPATSDANTDQVQIRLTINKSTTTVVAATNLVVSARFVMRNHKANTVAP